MARFPLLRELTFRGVLMPKGGSVELDPERDKRKIEWLAQQGVIPGKAGVVVAPEPAELSAPRPALRSWASGCCGRR